jgi:low affinity Fe/Cu permease
MLQTPANIKADVLPKNRAIYLETLGVIVVSLFSLFLQHGNLNYTILTSYYTGLVVIGSLSFWFVNKYILEQILQSRIEADNVTHYLPLELFTASFIVTSIFYVAVYSIFIYLEGLSFVLTGFLKGYFVSIGLTLFIVIIYVSIQIWNSWQRDGDFLFRLKDDLRPEKDTQDFITINNSKGTMKFELKDILYFISESKIAFLLDRSGKKWITQYNLSELEEMLGRRYFRLNRKILVSREVISQIKKLPNHRLLVTIDQPNEPHNETISRYKSTKFKQWFHSASK